MDLQDVAGRGAKVKLGLVERWGLTAAFGLLVFLLAYVFNSFDSRLAKQAQAMQDMVTAQAVTSAQLQALTSQLSDVPGLTRQMAELKVQVQRNSEDIHELQQVKRLR